MNNKNNPHTDFHANGGTTGAVISDINWSEHALGPQEDWPFPLRISLNMVLHSQLPMLLLWGAEATCFFNDAYLSSLDTKRSPGNMIGMKGKQLWPEQWASIQSKINLVRSRGKALWVTSQLFHSTGNNTRWKYDVSPIKNVAGKTEGVLVICKELSQAERPAGHLETAYEEKNHILEKITDGFYKLNEQWEITRWSPKAERILNVSREEVIGKNIWDLFPEAKGTKFYTECKKVMEQKSPASFEMYYEPWGKWYSLNVYPSGGALSVYFRDITEQRRLQLINEWTEKISGVAGWEYDVATQKVFLTSKAYEIYGLPEDEPITLETNKQLFSNESLNKIDEALDRAINRQESYEIELELIRRDGEERIIRINGFPQIENEKVTKLYGTIEDITQKKRDQEELERTNVKLKTALKIAKMGYWTHDLVEDMGDWSQEIYDIWELDPKEFVPTFANFVKTIHPEDSAKFERKPDEAFPEEDFYDTEHRIITPDGKVKWIFQRITLHRDEEGTPLWLEGIAQDVTELKQKEKELRETLKEKEVLLAEIHHRVKNNLAVVSGMMQLQAYEESDDKLRGKLQDSVARIVSMASIHEQLYHSGSFSNLDFSKNVQALVKKVIDAMQTQAQVTLDFDLEPLTLNVNQAIPCSLIINEVLTNILKHAFKEQQEGTITFDLSEEDNEVHLSIRDDGVGMPEKLDVAESSSLGLRLIDILAQQLEATYQYDSSQGTGTTFSIHFEKSEQGGIGSSIIF